MYPQHHWGLGSHGHHEANNCDSNAILSYRPDTLLANLGDGGASFLPSLPPSAGYMLPLPPLVPGQLQVSQASSGLAAAASPFRRAMSAGDDLLLIRDRDDDREEERRVAAAAPAPVRYSAEERRERLDKYRSKRNQRNFQKKITYACRKTLADSRPRVKGRFARNASDGTEADLQSAAAAAAPPQSESAESEWWPAAQHEAGVDLDDEMLAAYLGVSSISLYSPSASTTLPRHHYSYQP